MTTPDQTNPSTRVRRGRRAVRLTVIGIVVAAILFLVASSWLSGR